MTATLTSHTVVTSHNVATGRPAIKIDPEKLGPVQGWLRDIWPALGPDLRYRSSYGQSNTVTVLARQWRSDALPTMWEGPRKRIVHYPLPGVVGCSECELLDNSPMFHDVVRAAPVLTELATRDDSLRETGRSPEWRLVQSW
jgi:hypothetical protein